MVEGALVGIFQDHHATALDAWVVGGNRSGNEVGEGDVGDEAASLLHLQPRLFVFLPLGHAHLAAQHAGIDAHIGDGLGEHKGAAPGLAVLAGLWRRGKALVVAHLLRSAALVDGRERQESSQAGRGRAAVYPGQLEGRQGERQILWPDDKATLFRLHEGRGDAGVVKRLHHPVLSQSPFVGVALAGGHQTGHGSPSHAARRLDEHLQIETAGEAPLNLAHRVPWESEHDFRFGYRNRSHKFLSSGSGPIVLY